MNVGAAADTTATLLGGTGSGLTGWSRGASPPEVSAGSVAGTDVYAASLTATLLSNATYSNLGIMRGTTSQTGTTGSSRYVDATLASLAVARQLRTAEQTSILSDLDQYGGVNVSGTYYANPLAESEAAIKRRLKGKTSAAIMKQAAEDARKEREGEKAAEAAASEGPPKSGTAEAAPAGDGGETATSQALGNADGRDKAIGEASSDAAGQTAADGTGHDDEARIIPGPTADAGQVAVDAGPDESSAGSPAAPTATSVASPDDSGSAPRASRTDLARAETAYGLALAGDTPAGRSIDVVL